MLSREQVRGFYDRFGRRQDWQGFYEDVVTDDLIAHAGFDRARNVFEFGCGTGRFAADLLGQHLAESATYTGCDLSATMVRLARERLARFDPRVQVQLTDGRMQLPAPDGAFDRFVSNYVLDLLPTEEIALLLGEAHRVLAPEGRLCLVSLTHGVTRLSRLVSSTWARVHRLRPILVGGCRPIELLEVLREGEWMVEYRNVMSSFGIPSEVLIARKAGPN